MAVKDLQVIIALSSFKTFSGTWNHSLENAKNLAVEIRVCFLPNPNYF